MRYGLIAAAQAPFVSSKSTSVCFTSVRFYLSIHNVTCSHWKALIGSVLWNIYIYLHIFLNGMDRCFFTALQKAIRYLNCLQNNIMRGHLHIILVSSDRFAATWIYTEFESCILYIFVNT
jgi:hypothetical protein